MEVLQAVPTFDRLEDVPKDLQQHEKPFVIKSAFTGCPASRWTPLELASLKQGQPVMFRIGRKRVETGRVSSRLMETECNYVSSTVEDFLAWDSGDSVQQSNPFRKYPRTVFWAYADYKHLAEFFRNKPEVLDDVNWGIMGMPSRGGFESNMWLGTQGASTPCHYDSYGFNIVAQLYGRKAWILFDREDTDYLYPTRNPFEESSIFSSVDILLPDLEKHPKYSRCKAYKVVLEPKDVLYVPKHWWHFVECLELSISINTWIEVDSDKDDRCKEALARGMVTAWKRYQGHSEVDWLNPTEENMDFDQYFSLLQQAASDAVGASESGSSFSLSPNALVDLLASPRVVDFLYKEMLAAWPH